MLISTLPDFDECANDPFICPAHSHCVNTEGSYYCRPVIYSNTGHNFLPNTVDQSVTFSVSGSSFNEKELEFYLGAGDIPETQKVRDVN